MTDLLSSTLALRLKQQALALGLDLCGIAPAYPVPGAEVFTSWIQTGYAGEMGYLDRRREDRLDPSRLLPGVLSIVCAALSYRPSQDDWPLVGSHPISCYAWGEDYHLILKEKLENLASFLRTQAPGAKTKCYVDTGPILERSYAALAGLGWLGKNTTLLNEQYGSFLFLGEILTDFELSPDIPVLNQCGDCTMCLDSCPTGALLAPGVLDARQCISYLTLEHRSEIPTEFHGKLSGYLAGCDICQACCPFNAGAPEGREETFRPNDEMRTLDLEKAASLTEDSFRAFTKKSALDRVKYPMWRRNLNVS